MTLLVWEKFTFFSFFFLKKCLLKFLIRVGTKVLCKNDYFLHLLKIFQIRGMLLPAAFGYFLAKLVTLNNEAILFPIRVGTEVFCKNDYFSHLLKIFQIRRMLLPAAFEYFMATLVTLNNEAILFPYIKSH